MKTFAIYPKTNIKIEGVDFTPDDQVGVVTCDVRMETLLGLIQFGHATAEELDLDELSVDEPDADADAEVEPSAEVEAELEVAEGESEAVEPEPEVEATEASFISDGLDEKTAAALVAQGINTPNEIRKLISDGYVLTELEDIGKVRAENILKIYG